MTVVASKFDLTENELYETEEWATEALLKHVDLSGMIVWEPFAGRNKMVRVLRKRARVVITSDIADYGVGYDMVPHDFLDKGLAYPTCDGIISNPPFGKQNRTAVKVCELALQRCPGIVAMLLTAKFDSGSSRVHLLRDNPRFRGKIVLVDRIQWFPGEHSGTEDHAWFIFGPEPAIRPAPPPILIYEGRPRGKDIVCGAPLPAGSSPQSPTKGNPNR